MTEHDRILNRLKELRTDKQRFHEGQNVTESATLYQTLHSEELALFIKYGNNYKSIIEELLSTT